MYFVTTTVNLSRLAYTDASFELASERSRGLHDERGTSLRPGDRTSRLHLTVLGYCTTCRVYHLDAVRVTKYALTGKVPAHM